jgi:tetratricopeptide (TPR) repeat protein
MRYLVLLFLLLRGVPSRSGDATLGQSEQRKYYYEDIFVPFFARDDARGVYRSQRPQLDVPPSRFAISKSSGTLRVFGIGGSIAQIYLSQSIPPSMRPEAKRLNLSVDSLRDDLAAALSPTRVELLNCGMHGYDSYREAGVLEEVLAYSPDLILLMSGHNEGIASPPVIPLVLKTREYLSRWSAYRSLQRLVEDKAKGTEIPQEQAATREAAFENNLTDMIRHAKTAGVRIAVVSPPLNYRDAPTKDAAPLRDPGFMRGWVSFLHRDYPGAEQVWSAALSAVSAAPSPERSLLLFYLGRAEELQGHADAAGQDYEQSIDADAATVGRATPGRLKAIERISKEEGADWIDLDGAFRRSSSPGVPGLDWFVDDIHWLHSRDWLVSREIIKTLFPKVPERLWPQAQAQERDESLRTVRYALAGFQEDALSWRSVVYLEAVCQRHADWCRDVGVLEGRLRKGEPTLGIMPARSSSQRDEALLYWHIGEVLLRQGDSAGALRDFARARELDPKLKGVLLSRALAQYLSGDRSAALQSLDRAAASGLADEARTLRPILGLLPPTP